MRIIPVKEQKPQYPLSNLSFDPSLKTEREKELSFSTTC